MYKSLAEFKYHNNVGSMKSSQVLGEISWS